ncbi:acyl carrier protein [Variovorax sp. ZT4R33]|uniref:acyl carrier protein n=1 Tax=Variovorax sp. ZT4R33 TaxID=3443743 RepID=UPI003F467F43
MTELNLATIERAIRDALDAIRPGAVGLAGDADLMQEADLDSIGVMDLVMEIEDRLDLSIPVETLAQARTINGLRAGISQLSGGAS